MGIIADNHCGALCKKIADLSYLSTFLFDLQPYLRNLAEQVELEQREMSPDRYSWIF